ncbi:hypothetical protein STENM36S_05003 [Streptomyces tendae]
MGVKVDDIVTMLDCLERTLATQRPALSDPLGKVPSSDGRSPAKRGVAAVTAILGGGIHAGKNCPTAVHECGPRRGRAGTGRGQQASLRNASWMSARRSPGRCPPERYADSGPAGRRRGRRGRARRCQRLAIARALAVRSAPGRRHRSPTGPRDRHMRPPLPQLFCSYEGTTGARGAPFPRSDGTDHPGQARSRRSGPGRRPCGDSSTDARRERSCRAGVRVLVDGAAFQKAVGVGDVGQRQHGADHRPECFPKPRRRSVSWRCRVQLV